MKLRKLFTASLLLLFFLAQAQAQDQSIPVDPNLR